tara:strand:- start:510 stop:974 length:465 start_codon:yes stop_codon:yes gene_type:complete
MISQKYSENSSYILQYIRDLYDKIFPNAKDYIKFLQEEINTSNNKKYNPNSFKVFYERDKNYLKSLSNKKKVFENYHDGCFERDFWTGLKKKDIVLYKKLIERWLKTKTRRQRRIWNYFVLGVPKNSIAPRLKENSKFVIGTIKNLQKEFLNLF